MELLHEKDCFPILICVICQSISLSVILLPGAIKMYWYSDICRYGIVEGDLKKTRLFTISNPVVGSKNPGIVAKWCGKTFRQERTQSLPGVLSSLALSDDGRYLATGTMGGTVYLIIAFSLQVSYLALVCINWSHQKYVFIIIIISVLLLLLLYYHSI